MSKPIHRRSYGKIRSDCKLAGLARDQRSVVIAYCETVSLEEGARWLKEEYNMEISPSGLGKWLRLRREEDAAATPLQAIRDDRDRAMLVGKAFRSATEITDQNSVLFAQAIFEEFRKPARERDERRLVQFMSLALKAKGHELRERCVDLAYDRFHFDGAKAALAHAPELQRIRDSAADERSKIQQAMVLLFGKPIEVDEVAHGS